MDRFVLKLDLFWNWGTVCSTKRPCYPSLKLPGSERLWVDEWQPHPGRCFPTACIYLLAFLVKKVSTWMCSSRCSIKEHQTKEGEIVWCPGRQCSWLTLLIPVTHLQRKASWPAGLQARLPRSAAALCEAKDRADRLMGLAWKTKRMNRFNLHRLQHVMAKILTPIFCQVKFSQQVRASKIPSGFVKVPHHWQLQACRRFHQIRLFWKAACP